jgi:hypothetical protein
MTSVEPSMLTGRITFYRKRAMQDFFRSYSILVAGKEIGMLERSGSLSVDLPAGPHICQARIAWTGSPEQSIDVLANGETRVCVTPTPRGTAIGNMRRSVSTADWLTLVSDERSAAATE